MIRETRHIEFTDQMIVRYWRFPQDFVDRIMNKAPRLYDACGEWHGTYHVMIEVYYVLIEVYYVLIEVYYVLIEVYHALIEVFCLMIGLYCVMIEVYIVY